MQDKVYSFLGICQRAGKVKSGSYLCEEAVKNKEAGLVIITEDAKKNTRQTLENKCASYGVPLRYYGDKDSLGHAIGKEMRSCAAVTDEGMARNLMRLIDLKEQGERGQNGKEDQ